MTIPRRTSGVGTLLLLALVGLFVAGPLAAEAQARHQLELARGLARDFQFFDLAEGILKSELSKAEAASDEDRQAAAILAYSEVLNMWAEYASIRGDARLAREKREAAADVIRKLADLQSPVAQAQALGAQLQVALGLARSAEIEEDEDVRTRMRRDAIEQLKGVRDGFQRIVQRLFPGHSGESLSDEESDLFRMSWYHWGQSAYELARLGVEYADEYQDPTQGGNPTVYQRHIRLVLHQLDELLFEFDGTIVAFWAHLLMGDAHAFDGAYGQALGHYRTVLGNVPRYWPVGPGETPPPGAQAELDRLRLEAYYKTSLANLHEGDDSAVIRTVDAMLADYPEATNMQQVKLGRLLRAEAMIRQILAGERDGTLADVIAGVQPLAADPEAFFRYKFNEMMANIGMSPNLDLDTRMDCARSAYSIGMHVEAAQIYRMVLQSLRVHRDGPRRGEQVVDVEATRERFERYGPEAYWNLAMALYGQRRYMEASMVFYRASRLFTYFGAKFRDATELPPHMLTSAGTPRFERFESMRAVQQFPVELARFAAAAMTTWNPAGAAVNDSRTRREVVGAVEETWTGHAMPGGTWSGVRIEVGRYAETLRSRLEPEGAGNFRLLFNEGWRYQRGRTDGLIPAISMLTYVDPSVGSTLWLTANNTLAELMRREFNHRVAAGFPEGQRGDPFPEGATDQFPREVLDTRIEFARGAAFWRAERDRIGRTILAGLPERQREELRAMLDLIARFELSPEEQRATAGPAAWIWGEHLPRDVRLLYWFKARYYHLRFFYAVAAPDRSAIERLEPEAWNRSLGALMRAWSRVQTQRLRDASQREERMRLHNLVSNVAERLYFYGALMRNNPWAPNSRDPRQGFLAGEIGSEEHRGAFRIQALDVWADYHENWAAGFEFPGEEERTERAQRIFEERVRGILYIAFFMHLDERSPLAAEGVMREFDRLYPESVRRNDSQLASWYDEFVGRLHTAFQAANFETRNRLQDSVEELLAIASELRRDRELSLGDVRDVIARATMRLRVVRENDQPLIAASEEEVVVAFVYALVERATGRGYRTRTGGIDESALFGYVMRNPWLLETTGEPPVVGNAAEFASRIEAQMASGDPGSDEFEQHLMGPFRSYVLEQVAAFREAHGDSAFFEWFRIHESDQVFHDRDDLLTFASPDSPRFGGEMPRLNALALDSFADEMQARLESLANESLQRDGEALLAELRRLVEGHHIFLSDADFERFVTELRNLDFTGQHHPMVLRMHTGHQRQVVLNRFDIAAQIQRVASAYGRLVINLDGKALDYTYLVQQRRGAGDMSYRDWHRTGLRFFDARRWQPAIEYLTQAIGVARERESFRNFEQPPALDDAARSNRTLGLEIEYRYLLGRAHLHLAERSGGYDPEQPNWAAAEEHLTRLHRVINYYNNLRQQGFTGTVLFQSRLERFYFATVDALISLYTAKARYYQRAGNVDEARGFLNTASGLYVLVERQSVAFSPDQRMARYNALRLYYEIGLLADNRACNERLVHAWNQLLNAYQGRNPAEVVLAGDPTYDAAMARLYQEVYELAQSRDLDIRQPAWRTESQD